MGAEARRKLQRSPVPPVGGFALLLVMFVARPFEHEPHEVWFLVLGLLVVVGGIDDWRPRGILLAAFGGQLMACGTWLQVIAAGCRSYE